MEASPLGKLPPELRNHIYEYTLFVPGYIDIDVVGDEDDHILVTNPQVDARTLALTETCKQLRREALAVFFSTCDFLFEADELTDAQSRFSREPQAYKVRRWLESIGDYSSSCLTSMVINLGRWCAVDEDYTAYDFSEIIEEYTALFDTKRAKITMVLAAQADEHMKEFADIRLSVFDLQRARKNIACFAQSHTHDETTTEDATHEHTRYIDESRSLLDELVELLEASRAENAEV
ncbi:hypothetical protein LTR85_008778 [Meristemomyces frigidus]|nr:hypothetical protein LTR85_008778 [Meristemomyces frigidus]